METFKAIDSNSSGGIDLSEFKSLLDNLGITKDLPQGSNLKTRSSDPTFSGTSSHTILN